MDLSGSADCGLPLRQGIEAVKMGSKGRAAGVGWDEKIADGREDVHEPLQVPGRSKALHDPLSPSQRQMRVLRAIVEMGLSNRSPLIKSFIEIARRCHCRSLSNRSPLIKSFIEIARRCHCRSFDGSRTEGIAIALLVLLGASDGRLPGARLSSRSTPVRRMMVFAGWGPSNVFDAVCG
jgi:hypothetical protein